MMMSKVGVAAAAWMVGLAGCGVGHEASTREDPPSGTSDAAPTNGSTSGGESSSGTGGSGTPPSDAGADDGSSKTLPSGDLAAAQAFMKPLTLGFNVERGWAWSVPGGPKAEATALAAMGVTHVRVFFPWSPSNDFGLGLGVPGAPAMKTFLDAVAQWIAGGVTVFMDCTDVLGLSDFTSSSTSIHQVVQDLAQMAATYHFDPTRFAIGPVNEWAGDDGKGGDPFGAERLALHDLIRAALPGYVMTASSEYWDYYKNLEKLTPLADQRTIYSFHSYEVQTAAGWGTAAATPLTAWSKSHGGVPILWGEAGPGSSYMSSDPTTPAAWPGHLAEMVPAMAVFRPTLWAITYGGAFRMNVSSTDATIRPDLAPSVVQAVAAARSALVTNNGAP